MRAKEIATKLAERAEAVAKHLLPAGKLVGDEWKVGNVFGEPGGSLGVAISGTKKGRFYDFATNEGGDLLELWRLNGRTSLSGAIKEAARYLGMAQSIFEPVRAKKFNRPLHKNLASQLTQVGKNYLLEKRKLKFGILQKFKIASTDYEIIFPFWRDGELMQIKKLAIERTEGKKKIFVEKNCEPCLFGWQALSDQSRNVVLTEGEIDAITLHQYGFNALSLPFGGGKGQKQAWLEYEFDRLAIFDEIFLCMDQDEVGQATVMELVERLGAHRCRVVILPHKDANECLQQNITTEQMQQYFAEALSFDPSELKSAASFSEAVKKAFYPDPNERIGYHPPWDKAKQKIVFRPEELSLWTGINGHGKSQLLGHLALSLMAQGARVCIASLELKPNRLLMRMTRQAAGLQLPTEQYIDAIHDWYQDKLWIFDLVGNTKTSRLLEVFLYARQRYGIDVFIIDSLMKCGIGEEDYAKQKEFVEQLCDFKNQHQCQIHLVVHPRKGFDESRAPGKMDIKGTGSISDLADNSFVVWRNKHKEQAIQQAKISNESVPDELKNRYDCLWICDKNRNGEWEGKIALWFDAKSLQYLGFANQKPHCFVQYSNQNKQYKQNVNEVI